MVFPLAYQIPNLIFFFFFFFDFASATLFPMPLCLLFQSPKTFSLSLLSATALGSVWKGQHAGTTMVPLASAETGVIQALFIDERGIPVVVTCSLHGYRGGRPFHGWQAIHGFLCVDAWTCIQRHCSTRKTCARFVPFLVWFPMCGYLCVCVREK